MKFLIITLLFNITMEFLPVLQEKETNSKNKDG